MVTRIITNIPNILTISRMCIIPVIVFIMGFKQHTVTSSRIVAGLFIYACITDFLDGFLARLLKAESILGSALDPIADKILIISIMIILVHYRKADLLPSIAIACREILVSGLREFLGCLRVSLPVSQLSKIKTFLQMTAIFILVLGDSGSGLPFTDLIGRITLWLAAALTLITGYAYLRASYKYFLDTKDRKTG